MINLSKRLKSIADFVLDDQNTHGVIDVGCDHALLDIYLLENKSTLKVIASDVKEGPLKRARENIYKYGLLDKIKLYLSDGLSFMEEDIDTIVISGMGADTIVDIFQRGKEQITNVKKIIISSNGKYPKVRESISKLGFKIDKEKIVLEDGKYYIIIKFIKGEECYSSKELYFGPYLLQNKNEMFSKYYQNMLNEKRKILEALPESNTTKRSKLETEIKLLSAELI